MFARSNNAAADAGEGRLAENIMYFVRTLRAAGLPLGPGRTLEALRAVEAVGFERREDFYWALHAALVNRKDQQELFDQAFQVFWRNPKFLERLMSMMMPELQMESPTREEDSLRLSRRLAEVFAQQREAQREEEPEGDEEQEIDAVLTWSGSETLRSQDFEQMSADELEAAKRAITMMRLPLNEVRTRRFQGSHRPVRADLRRSLRDAMRGGSDTIPLKWKEHRKRRPPLVVLCDISGSMSRYSRMALHFMHALTNDRDRVFCFVFGTRLTNITRYLRHKDVDEALAKAGEAVLDWSGGTRLGASLETFNRDWGRRVLGQGAVVLLISDGLDREGAEGVEKQMERLHKSCRRLIWLNPLLRYDGYQPKSMGAKAMMPHVDEFRTIHNLEALEDLAGALSGNATRRGQAAEEWREALQ